MLKLVFTIHISTAEVIRSVEMRGTKNITLDTVMFYSGINVGDKWDSAAADHAVKKLYATGWFENVSLKINQGHLVCTLKDNPIIAGITYKGNTAIWDKPIQNLSALVDGGFLNKDKCAHDLSKIKQIYASRGNFFTKIEPITKIENDKAKITFSILEGKEIFIKNINIIGNRTFSAEYLKSKLRSKMQPIFRILGYNPTYNASVFEQDKALLENLYHSKGFLEFSVTAIETTMSRSLNKFEVDFILSEGPQYKLGEVKIIEDEFPKALLPKIYNCYKRPKDKFCNLHKIHGMAQQMTANLQKAGHIQMSVKTMKKIKDDVVDINFVCKNDQELILIKKISIYGNLKTDEQVIRRTLALEEGGYYSSAGAEKSTRALHNLGFFAKSPEAVAITKQITEPGIGEIQVKVLETTTGRLSGGINFVGGREIFATLTESNLSGKGVGLKFTVGGGMQKLFCDTQIAKPLGQHSIVDFGINAYYTGAEANEENTTVLNEILTEKLTGDKRQQGFTVSSGIKNLLADGVSLYTSCSLEHSHTENNAISSAKSSDYRLQMLDPGSHVAAQILNSFTHKILRELGDFSVAPSSFDYSVSHVYCKAFQGAANFHKFLGSANLYLPVLGKKLAIQCSANAGAIKNAEGNRIRTQDCFTLGDQNMRGFGSSGCDPYVTKNNKRHSHGGDRYYSFSAELRSSLFFPDELPITGLAFFDCGNIWRQNKVNFAQEDEKIHSHKLLRKSLGIGMSVNTGSNNIKLSWVLWSNGHPKDQKSYLHLGMDRAF